MGKDTKHSPHRPSLQATLAALLALCADLALAADDFPRGRLPATAIPSAYRLDLTVDPDQPRFSGHVEIDVELKTATRMLYMHGRDLAVSTATISAAGQTRTVRFTQLDEAGAARVDFDGELPAGRATLSFDYDAPFGDGPSGMYRIKVADAWYAWSQFESIDARAAFPSFDEPGFKAPFTVSVTTRPGLMAVSNMPETGVPSARGALVRHTFLPSPPLPTYLVAFAVGPFISVEGVAPPTAERNHPLPLRIIATRNHAGKLDYALRETPRIVELLENYFGMPFPFPKLDQIASPVMPGAMENAGADIYGDNILLLEAGASTRQKQTFGMVVAHELAHQWFGDYVTPAWWEDIWLNESFANWMGYRIGNEWRPELNIGVNAIEEALRAMNPDSLATGRPIQQPIATSGEVDSAFDDITYGKGGQIIAMIAAYLGDAKFRDGVRLHLHRHPYGNAVSTDFFAALAQAAGDPRVITAMKSFVEQQGMPVVDLVPRGTAFTATQSRYLQPGSKAPDQQWVIPFCVRRTATRTCTLLDVASQSFEVPGSGTLVPNAGGTGYYRYRLPPAEWDALIADSGSLSAGEALAAIDSLWAQVTSQRLPAAKLLQAASNFSRHPDSNVALMGGSKLATWHRRGIIGADNADYRRLMATLFAGKLRQIGFDPGAGAHASDPADLQKQREELVFLVSEEARDVPVRRQLGAAARDWLSGDAKALDPSYYLPAFMVHVEDGKLPSTQALFERALRDMEELPRGAALDAVALSGRKADAAWLLGRFADPRLRSTDKLSILGNLMEAPATRDVAFDWLRSNYDDFAKRMGLFATLSIPTLPRTYCSAEDAAKVQATFLPKVVASGRGELPFRRMLESIRSCGRMKQSLSAEMAAALKQAAATP